MNDVFVTCIKNGRVDQFGRPLVNGASYTLSWNLARDLWLSGYVSVTNASIFDASSVDVRRPNLAAELAAINAQVAAHQAFIIGGQSNADSHGTLVGATPSAPNVFMLDKGEVFRVATEPLGDRSSPQWVNNIPSGSNPSAPGHSFGLVMGKKIANLTGVTPLLVPCAIGSTALTDWRKPAGALDMTTLFGALILRAQKAKRGGIDPVFVWFGHESSSGLTTYDYATGVIGNEYLWQWAKLIEEIREYFPNSKMMFCQLSASNADKTVSHHLTGEVQRRSHDLGGTSAKNVVLNVAIPQETDATNTVTLNADGTIRVVGDGSRGVGFQYQGLVNGGSYELTVTVTGTGLFKVLANQQKAGSLGAGTHTIKYTADAATLSFYRNASGQPVDLTFRIDRLGYVGSGQITNSYMVVTHDLPRHPSPDDIHLGAEAQKEVGRRLALLYADEVLGVSGVSGKGPRLVSVTSTDETHTKVKFTQDIAAAKAGETNYGDGTDSLFRVYDAGAEKSVSSVAIDGSDATALIITHASCSGLRVISYGNRNAQDAQWRKGVVYNTETPPLPAAMFLQAAT